MLEGPVRVSGKTVAFDAQFYLAHRVTLLASLQFFNANDMEFDDVGAYFVCAKVRHLLLLLTCHVDTNWSSGCEGTPIRQVLLQNPQP